jgi:hypothetical protein
MGSDFTPDTQHEHADFLNDPMGRDHEWRITSWMGAVRCALGPAAWWRYVFAIAVALSPAALLTAYGALHARWGLVALGLAGLWGYFASSTQPTAVGMLASMIVAAVGAVAGLAQRDWVLMAAACLPGVTWFASCAILGVASGDIAERLKNSAESFEQLKRQGLLTARRRAAPPLRSEAESMKSNEAGGGNRLSGPHAAMQSARQPPAASGRLQNSICQFFSCTLRRASPEAELSVS